MKFLARLRQRLRKRRNPNLNNPFPTSTAGEDHPGDETAQSLDEEDDDDDYQTAATWSEWREDDDDDENEISSTGLRYADGATSSTSSSFVRRRTIANDENSIAALVNDATSASSVMAVARAEGKRCSDCPPADDCCPICFGTFSVPCRAPCGHWYCGGCILQYWNYGAALQPCNCPMCSRKITCLTPEASLVLRQDVEVKEILKNVQKYNRLFVGGLYGFVLKMLESPLYIKRIFQDMLNPDRPGAHLNKLRIFAMVMGLLYTISPFDILRLGRQNVIDVFDYSAMAISFVLYLIGLYLRRRRFQRVREIAAIQP